MKDRRMGRKMKDITKNWKGILICFVISVPVWFLGKRFEIVGGAVIAILMGMTIALFWKDKGGFEGGIKFTSKKVLQWAVILLGFGLNLGVVYQTGMQSLPIIVCTIATSLIIAFVLHKVMHIPGNISTLVGCGSSICGGSAVAASTWDNMWGLGTQTLDKAVTVKLTRTLAIIPITLVLAFIRAKQSKSEGKKVNLKSIFPFFILYFIGASLITTIAASFGVASGVFAPFKTLSKFFIVMAMAAIGLNTDIVKLIKNGGKPIVMGASCWIGITAVSLILQRFMGIW